MKQLRFLLLAVLCFLFSWLVACTALDNTIFIENDAKTDQPIHFNCAPRARVCPYRITRGTEGVFKQVKSITMVCRGKIRIIYFAKRGTFRLKTSDILSAHQQPAGLSGQCQSIEIYATQEKIKCR